MSERRPVSRSYGVIQRGGSLPREISTGGEELAAGGARRWVGGHRGGRVAEEGSGEYVVC